MQFGNDRGQKAKYPLRADIFRFGPNNGHRSIGSACPKSAHKQTHAPQQTTAPFDHLLTGWTIPA
jgi:hypothetical protein